MDKGGAIFALLTVSTVMLGSWFFAGLHVSMTTEELAYRTLYELEGNIELREYGEITFVSTSSNDIDDAFSILSSYISRKNMEKKNIDMIFPVIIFGDDTIVNMSFILPAEYSADTAPSPINPEITIHNVSSRKVAAIRFSGYAKSDIIEEKRSVLISKLDENDLVTKGDFFLMCYNPPWIPPALMRNEIAVEVD
jgi:effector-binding domain-containing protein